MKISKQRLNTSMTCMDKNNLYCQEICDIIKICGESGVLEFNYQDLRIVYKDSKPISVKEDAPQFAPGQDAVIYNPDNDLDLITEREANVKEDQLSHMHLRDPLQYEEMLLSEDIIDEEENQDEFNRETD